MVKSFTLAVMIKSCTLAVMMDFACLTAGSTPDTCFGDVLHLVRPRGNLRTRAVVMILTMLDFFFFSPLKHLGRPRGLLIPGKRSCPF